MSKTKVEICPAMLTLGGEMQKMSWPFRRLTANTIPQLMAAGIAGGTAIKIMSRALSRRISGLTPIDICIGMVEMLVTMANTAMMPTNFNPSE